MTTRFYYTIQLNETEPRWTFPIELYKRRLKWKGINSGQNGVRMIAGSQSAAFGQSTSNSAPVCIHMPPEPANRHYSVPLKHSWRYLITNWWITRRIQSNNALATVGDLNGPITGVGRMQFVFKPIRAQLRFWTGKQVWCGWDKSRTNTH